MTELLTFALAAFVLMAGLTMLVRFARHDSFAAPGTGHQLRDELGPLGPRRRPA